MNPQFPVDDDPLVPPLEAVRQLPRERLPERELWSGIEQRIRPARRRASPWPYALAASLGAALLTGALLRMPSADVSGAPGEPVGTVAEAAVTPPDYGAVAPYSTHTALAHGTAGLSSRALRTLRSESLDNAPALVAERATGSGLMKATWSAGHDQGRHSQQAILRANLKLVSQAEREVRRALRADPESASLQSLLVVAQEKRAALTSLLVHEQD